MTADRLARFDGQVALITGAGRGLGQAIARRIASEGGTVLIGDLSEAGAKATADVIAAETGASAQGAALDVTDPDSVAAWVQSSQSEFGRVDIMVNNAGILQDARVEDMTDQQWQAVIDVNLRGAFHCIRAVFPLMRERRYGRILSMASMSWRGNFGQANYSASKAGLVGMARTIAAEGAPHGITSNLIAPGPIATDMLASIPERAQQRLADQTAMKRVGTPDEIAAAAAYLCSPEAGFTTGVVLDVDGGVSLGMSLR